jgi:hypothetical protein
MTTMISNQPKPEEIELLQSFGRSRSAIHTSKGNATIIALPFVCTACMFDSFDSEGSQGLALPKSSAPAAELVVSLVAETRAPGPSTEEDRGGVN